MHHFFVHIVNAVFLAVVAVGNGICHIYARIVAAGTAVHVPFFRSVLEHRRKYFFNRSVRNFIGLHKPVSKSTRKILWIKILKARIKPFPVLRIVIYVDGIFQKAIVNFYKFSID